MVTSPLAQQTCWLWGGETTVTVTGEGTGGRNQESALAAALELEAYDGSAVFLSGGTDGIDGPTDAAGAWATTETSDRAREAGYDPSVHLADNDAYPFFDAMGQLLRPGPTHTNVMDVQVGIMTG
jgi:hydroxypyruvate reductase